jgi:hypothetical protein
MKRCALAALAIGLASCLSGIGSSFAEVQQIQQESGAAPVVSTLGIQNEAPNGYAAASLLLTGSNLATSFVNFRSNGEAGSPGWTAYAGVLGGVAGIGLGVTEMLDENAENGTALGFTNVLTGTLSLIAGGTAILRAKHQADVAEATVHPHGVTFGLGVHKGMAPGFGLKLRF